MSFYLKRRLKVFFKYIFIFLIICSIVSLVSIIILSINESSPNSISKKSKSEIREAYESYYFGVVEKKYIAKNDHARRKVFLPYYQQFHQLISYEGDSLYSYINVGDTILKERNTLEFRLKRGGYDTIIELNFKNLRYSYQQKSYIDSLRSVPSSR